jgi:FtsZ-binding cell division protein ZapB
VAQLEKFEKLEKGVNELVERHSLLKNEKDSLARSLRKESSENQMAQERLERLYRERYKIRSKIDSLIAKLDGIIK